MSEAPKIVTQAEIDMVWGSADFGSMSRMAVVKLGILKCVSGYHQGQTAMCIIRELGLITKNYTLSKRGKACLWAWFSGSSNF